MATATATKSTTELLSTEPIPRLFIRMAIPAVTAQVVNTLYVLVDRVYIGRMEGSDGLALTGVGVCMSLIAFINAFTNLVSMGGAPRASMMLGKNDEESALSILGNCFTLLLTMGVLLTAFFALFSEPLLLSFGASENTIPYAMSYMNVYIIGTISVQLSMGMNAFITAQGFAKTSMMTILIGAVINIILDPIFIFTLNLGVAGAALATIISQTISAIWVIRFLTGKKTKLKLQKKYMKFKKEIIMPCIFLGTSPFIMSSTEGLLNISFNSSLLKYGGDIAVGTMTIMASLWTVVMMPLFGFAQGAQPITSFNYGAKNVDRVRQSVSILIKVAFSYTMVVWAIYMLFPRAVVSIFAKSSPELIDYASWAIYRYAPLAGLMGLQLACQQCFLALGQTKVSLFLALLRKIFLLIPLIFILPMFMEDKVAAVFLAEPVSDFIAIATTCILFYLQFGRIMTELEVEKDNAVVLEK
ncbi:MAG: MATE family efflux transporter [Bacillota bacterium]